MGGRTVLRLVTTDEMAEKYRDCVCTARNPCLFHAMEIGPRYVRRGRAWKRRVVRSHRKQWQTYDDTTKGA